MVFDKVSLRLLMETHLKKR